MPRLNRQLIVLTCGYDRRPSAKSLEIACEPRHRHPHKSVNTTAKAILTIGLRANFVWIYPSYGYEDLNFQIRKVREADHFDIYDIGVMVSRNSIWSLDPEKLLPVQWVVDYKKHGLVTDFRKEADSQ